MSLVSLHFEPREHGWRDRLYRICGTCKNYPPEQALLDVGFMTIFRRADCFILIWACIAVLADHRQRSFSKFVQAPKRKPQKQERVLGLVFFTKN